FRKAARLTRAGSSEQPGAADREKRQGQHEAVTGPLHARKLTPSKPARTCTRRPERSYDISVSRPRPSGRVGSAAASVARAATAEGGHECLGEQFHRDKPRVQRDNAAGNLAVLAETRRCRVLLQAGALAVEVGRGPFARPAGGEGRTTA